MNFFKKLEKGITIVILVFLTNILFAQTVYIQNSVGGFNFQAPPFNTIEGYTRDVSIYKQSEFNKYCAITKLGWRVNTPQNLGIPIKIYLKTTSATSLTSGETWASLKNGATMVYSGTQIFSVGSGFWHFITLTTPFNYSSGNLMVLVETNYGGNGLTTGNRPLFYNATPIFSNSHKSFKQNLTPPDDNSIGGIDNNRPYFALNFSYAGIAGNDTSICAGGTAQLKGTGVCGVGPYSYSWSSNPSGFTSALQNPTVTPTATTTYTLTTTDIGNGNSIATDMQIVTILTSPEKPTQITTDRNNICVDDNGNITLTAVGGSGSTLEWFQGTCGSNKLGEGTSLTIASPVVTTKYFARWKNNCGNSSCDSITINIKSLPIINNVTVTNSTNCGLSNGQILINATGDAPLQYSINSGASYGFSNSFTGLGVGSYHVVVQSSFGCITSGNTYSISAPGSPSVPYVKKDSIYCYSSSLANIIVASTPSGNQLKWYSDPLLTNEIITGLTVINADTLALMPSHTVGTTKYYAVQINGTCKSAPSVVTITILPQLSASAGSDNTICYGTNHSGLLIGGSNTATGGSPNYTYNWSSLPVSFSSNLSNPSVNPIVNTTYLVKVTDSYGCTATSSTKINILPELLSDAGSNGTICFGTNQPGFQLGGSSTASGGSPTYYYSWSSVPTSFASNAANPVVNPTVNTTYQVTVTDNKGCSASSSVNITVHPELFAHAGANATVCYGTNHSGFQLGTANTASGGTPTYNYSWSSNPAGFTSNTANPLVNPTVNTTYIVTVTDNQGCTASSQVQITIRPQLFANAGTNDTICYGTNHSGFQLGTTNTASGGTPTYTYSWASTPTGFTANSANPVVNPTVSTTYLLTVSDSEGCSATSHVQITIRPELFANAGTNDTICFGTNHSGFQLGTTNTASGGTPTYFYSWASTPTGFTATLANPIVNPTVSTTYLLTVSDSEGCSDTSQVQITIRPELFANAGTNDTICYGTNHSGFQLGTANTASGGTPTYTYSWASTPTGFTANSANPIVNPTVSTTYLLTVSDSQGCSATSHVQITIRPELFANAGTNDTICFGTNHSGFQLGTTNTASGGSPTYTYSWASTPTGFTSTSANPIVNPTVSTTYLLTVSDSQGCSATSHVQITIRPELFANAGTNDTICYGTNHSGFQLGTANTASGGTPTYTYSWASTPTGFTANSANPIVNPTVSTTYLLTVSDSQGCSATSHVQITIRPELFANAGTNDTICYGTNHSGFQLGTANTASGGTPTYTYIWASTPTGFTSTSANPIVNPTVSTTYLLTVSDSEGCTATSHVQITIRPELFANAGTNNTICYGTNHSGFQIGGSPTALGGNPTYTYNWSSTPSGFASTTANPMINPTISTTYTITVSDIKGCSASSSIQINVRPQIFANAGQDQTICEEQQIPLNAQGGNNYEWSNGEQTSTIQVKPSITTTYTVSISDINGCTASDDVIVNVKAKPTIDLTPDQAICEGDTASIICSGGNSYNWSTGATNSSIMVNPTVTSSYTVTVSYSNGCDYSAMSKVNVSSTPYVYLITNYGPSNKIFIGQTIKIEAIPDGYDNYDFIIDDVTVQSGSDNVYFTNGLTEAKDVTVVTTDGTCSSNNKIFINVIDLPNAYTPNGDGVNDRFIKDMNVTIFNRWGQELYSGAEGWDGTYNSKDAAAGTYYYVIKITDFKGAEQVLKGSVMLVRE